MNNGNIIKYPRFGRIKPNGWLYEKMEFDLTKGYVGQLDELLPELIVCDEIYGKDRLSIKIKSKDVGNLTKNDKSTDEDIILDNAIQYLWWNSETQSNWRDGLIRNSYLINNKKYIEKVDKYILDILNTQDEDGYIGIYDKDIRFKTTEENGELWAQTTLFRGLLGYYEVTGNKEVLNAVIKAVELTMNSYPIHKSNPFEGSNGVSAQTHGLTFTDVLETLYQYTNNSKYIQYALWLYEDYNKYKLMEEDTQLKNLLDLNYCFKGHGPHTYEHLRILVMASYYTKQDLYNKALNNYLTKLDKCISPSGGPIGDEWIMGNYADASLTGYEFCSIQELLHSYSLMLQKTNDMTYADKIEWLYYNAALGSIHPIESSIAYLNSDNAYAMEGCFQFDQPHSVHAIQTRYKYSPVHQDAAVCCIPNASRITPYFLNNFFYEEDDSIIVALYGPSKYTNTFNNTKIEITQNTKYPSDFKINFKIDVSKTIQYKLKLRKPQWANNYDITIDSKYINEIDNIIVIEKEWSNIEEFEIEFYTNPKYNSDLLDDIYFSYGPLVYAKPINAKVTTVKTYTLPDFRDLHYKAIDDIPNYVFTDLNDIEYNLEENDNNYSYLNAPTLIIKNNTQIIKLVPMGNTILRRVTFKRKL